MKSLLLSLLAVLIPYCKEESDSFALQNQHIEKLKEVLRYISDHYMDELSIEELARICCFSQSYFIHFLKSMWACPVLNISTMFALNRLPCN